MKKRDRLRKKHAKMVINEYRKLCKRGAQHVATTRTTTASIAIGIYRIIAKVRIKTANKELNSIAKKYKNGGRKLWKLKYLLSAILKA